MHLLAAILFQFFTAALLASSLTTFSPPDINTFTSLLLFFFFLLFDSLLVHLFPLVPFSFIPSIYSALIVRRLIAAVSFPGLLSAWSGCLWQRGVNGVSVCLTWTRWLSELTAHKRPVIPCVKECYWHGPFNLTPPPSKFPAPSSPPYLYSHPPLLYLHLYPSSCFSRAEQRAVAGKTQTKDAWSYVSACMATFVCLKGYVMGK